MVPKQAASGLEIDIGQYVNWLIPCLEKASKVMRREGNQNEHWTLP